MDLKTTKEELQREKSQLEQKLAVNRAKIEELSAELGIEPDIEIIDQQIKKMESLLAEKSEELKGMVSDLENI